MADATYQGRIYRKQGGAELVFPTGTALTLDAGSTISQGGANSPYSVGFTPAAGASNVCEVTLQVKDGAGTALAGIFHMDLWLSDAADGEGLTGTTASGAVAAKASSGTDLGTLTTKKALRVQTKDDGTYILSITDTSKTGFYVAATVPGSSRISVSSQLVTGNYG